MKQLSFLLILFLLISCISNNSKIFEWRGPNRAGIYHETNLLKIWPENGPELIWETSDLGAGYGSPVIAQNQLFVMGVQDSVSVLFAFNLKGELIHRTEVGKEWVVNFPGSRCTPTVIDHKVYVMTGVGDVTCVDAKNGKVIWTRNVQNDFDGMIPRFGYAESLVIDGDKVFCSPGGEVDNVVALNRFNGELIWSCPGKGERPGYHPASLISVGDRKIYLTFSAYHLMGIDSEKGQMLWSHEQINTEPDQRNPGIGDTHANTVLFDNNVLYYVEGDGNCAVALQLNDDGTTVEQIWNNVVVDNFMGGIVLHNNYIYSSNHSANQLVKIDIKNGAVTETLPIGRGSLILADNMLYYYNLNGLVYLVQIDNDKMNEVSKFTITKGSKEHFAHPVIDQGVLYIRHGEFLGAYRIKTTQ